MQKIFIPVLKDKNLNIIDSTKLVLSFFVIAIHTETFYHFQSELLNKFFESLFTLAVPFFFMTSGFLLFRKVELPIGEKGFDRLKNYIVKSIKLYVIWTLIYIPLTIYGFITYYHTNIVASIIYFFRGFLLVGENFYSWPLWYMLALVVAVSIIYVLLKLKLSLNQILIVALLLFIAGYFLGQLEKLGELKLLESQPTIVQLLTKAYFKIFLKTRNGFFIGFLYVSLGMLTAYRGYIKSNYAIVLGLIIAYLGVMFNCPFFEIIYFYLFFNLILKFNLIGSEQNFKKHRNISTIVYFTHMLWIALFQLFIFGNEINLFLLFVLTLICSVAFSYLLIKMQEHKSFKFIEKIY